MSKDLEQGLDVVETTATETKEAREKKIQTAEEKAVLIAGCEQIASIGVTPNFTAILATVPAWNDSDKTVVEEARKTLVAHFGTSEKLKDYLETEEFKTEFNSFQGIAKAMPVFNNVRSYYARRANAPAAKVKRSQVSIDGTIYSVNADYVASLVNIEKAERKQLVLAHADTKPVEVESF